MVRSRSTGTKPPVLELVRPQDLSDGADVPVGSHQEAVAYNGESFAGLELRGAVFSECSLTGVSLDNADLTAARFMESTLENLYAPVLRAAKTSFRDVEISNPRLGSADLHSGSWNSVRVDGGKIDFLDLRDCSLTNVLFSDCIIGELDLEGARLNRVAFRDCRIDSMLLGGGTAVDADLRGSVFRSVGKIDGLKGFTVDEEQLMLLAPLFAAELGLRVEA
ncbi:pentapeptide repeat-containing protein [Arthrobacter sp. zg-Y859]|uniref:Pentapeptide repeat-containing protein n=1 Tax=Arthrobacter jinronghuae TaxID=2964609 RepID=A0ABT1NPI0_9MICC|nr:pentapeptide repeat-containing protein [Arthrobacter jinronghuae]MCQ1948476.1 pentapeptide repeat-containing protein [Arthrobacter jinronghuae]UWX78698.1 pentapeptide repeat-containing protein [Arthrobacter jinronghuae]